MTWATASGVWVGERRMGVPEARLRVNRREFGNGEVDGVVSPDSGELFPLSPAQLGIWYAQALDPLVPVTIAQYVDLRGPLDRAILRRSAIDGSAVLGSGFLCIAERDGQP